MDIVSLLNFKLEKELFDELKNELDDNISEELLLQMIKDKIDKYPFYIAKVKDTKIIDNQCCARCMGPRYSDVRCANKSHEGDYCKKHAKQIVENDYLKFGRYDEPRPLFNDKNNPIPWEKYPKIDILDNILQNQWSNMESIIKNNLHKQRQITP